jgi:hypothetical protein
MEKDLYQGQRWDPKKGPQGLDKTAKPISAEKMKQDSAKLLNKVTSEMFVKPTIFSDDSGSHVLGKDGNVKASFTIADHGASHEGAAVAHLQQNFDSYMNEEIEELDEGKIDPAKSTSTLVHQYGVGADDVKKNKDGSHRFYRGFFYRSGSSSGHAKNISKGLESYGIKHDVVDHGTQDYKPFKGGASVRSQNHHWVDIKIHPGQKIDPEHDYKAVHEEVEDLDEAAMNPYAVGMAAAEKSTGDTPPLKKSTITKAHKIAKDVMKENKILTGALSRLEEGRGRPPKEGSAAWHRQQAAASAGKPKEEPVALGMQLRKAKSINAPVTFDNGDKHEIHSGHIDRFEDHMAARKTSQDKADFQKRASASHEAFKKAVSEPVPTAKKDTGEIVKYRH